MSKEIEKEVAKLRKKIQALNTKIADIRDSCPHTKVKTEYGSNTGNYDPGADCYWIDVDCLECGQHMHFDSERDKTEYRFYSLKNRE